MTELSFSTDTNNPSETLASELTLSKLRLNPDVDEQRFAFDPELFTEDILRTLDREYDIFLERTYNDPVEEDGDQEDWVKIGKISNQSMRDLQKVRYLCSRQPHCVRALALYVFFLFGSDFAIELIPIDDDDDTEEVDEGQKKKARKVTRKSRRLWEQFTDHNFKSWNVFEYCRRIYRDGEQFTHKKSDADWPPEARFIDREWIDDPAGTDEDHEGIVTDPDDTTVPIEYLMIEPESRELITAIDAEQIVHTKIDCDANEKRGVSRFMPVVKTTRMYEAFVENEVTHRQAQASIVLVRKVQGRRGPVRTYDNSQTSTTTYREGVMSREKWRPGTIFTVGPDVELDFAQPHSDFTDASPLAKMLLQQLCVAVGFTYSQITQDMKDGNYASELVHESPVLQMIKYEQCVLGRDLKAIFKWVIETAIEHGEFKEVGSVDEVWEKYEPRLKFFDPVSRDPLKLAQLLNLLVISQIFSRQQARRELNVDNDRIEREIEQEKESMMADMAMQNPNPDEANMRQTSKQNASAGGTNQGDKKPIQHRDKLPTG